MESKKFYWIKLKEEFFDSYAVKRLRKLAGGDTYTIIYLRMQLLAMRNEGVIELRNVNDSITYEVAVMLDEEPDNVEVCLQYLQSNGLAEITIEGGCFLPETLENTGKEGESAARMRKHRQKENRKLASQCDADVTFALNSKSLNNSIIDKDINSNNIYDYNNIKDNNAEAFFTTCWQAYPRKKGKGQVKDATKKRLAKEVGLEQMLRCIERYKAEMVGRDEQYIMYGSTFFNSGYVDYLDENYETKNDLHFEPERSGDDCREG